MKKHLLLSSAVVFIFILSMTNCKKETEVTEPEKEPFVIENLGIRFGPWDRVNNTAGDFLFLDISNVTKIVSEFGVQVVSYDGSLKYLPTIDFIIREQAPVCAVAEGKVTRVFYQEGALDWEIGVQSRNDPDWEVGYDHLVDLQVEMDDIVEPGDTLGYPRPLFEGLAAFELMINSRKTGLSYCPFCCMNPDKLEAYEDSLIQLIQDWETYKNDTTLYDESTFVYPGCLMESMVSY